VDKQSSSTDEKIPDVALNATLDGPEIKLDFGLRIFGIFSLPLKISF
jgi:hypothetical protein